MKSPATRLEAMTEYLLSDKMCWSVADKMSGDIADLSIEVDDTAYIEWLLHSNKSELVSVAVSALYLAGPLSRRVAQKLKNFDNHPSPATRTLIAYVIFEYGTP